MNPRCGEAPQAGLGASRTSEAIVASIESEASVIGEEPFGGLEDMEQAADS